jgi:hypothetical protein
MMAPFMNSIRRRLMRWIVVVALLGALVGCKKKEEPRPSSVPAVDAGLTQGPVSPASAAPGVTVARGEILGTGTVGSIDELVTTLEPYLSAMGASGLTVASVKATVARWIGLATWDGVDGARPVRFWLLNPKKYTPPFLVALPMREGRTVQTQGWASEAVAGHALLAKNAGTLAALRAAAAQEIARPPAVTGSVVRFSLAVEDLLTAYQADIEKLLAKAGQAISGLPAPSDDAKKLVSWMAQGLVALAKQVREVEAELSVGKDHARVMLRLSPNAGSALAAFLGAPRPELPDQASLLPGDSAIAWVFRYDPQAVGRAVEQIASHMEAMGKEGPGAFAKMLRQSFLPFLSKLRGDWSYVRPMSGGGFSMHLLGSREPRSTLDSLRTLLGSAGELWGLGGPPGVQTKTAYTRNVGKYKGIDYDRQRVTYDYSKLPDFQRKLMEQLLGKTSDTYLAATKDMVLLSSGRGTSARPIENALEQVMGKPARSLAEKAEFRELQAQLPPGHVGILYFSFVDYLKSTFAAMTGGKAPPMFKGIASQGFLGGGFSVESGALRVDLVATRSQIDSIRKFFDAFRGVEKKMLKELPAPPK